MKKVFKCSKKCLLEFEIIKTTKGKKLRSRFAEKDNKKHSSWNYILGHKILNNKFSDLEIFEKIENNLMPKFLSTPQAKELIRIYEES